MTVRTSLRRTLVSTALAGALLAGCDGDTAPPDEAGPDEVGSDEVVTDEVATDDDAADAEAPVETDDPAGTDDPADAGDPAEADAEGGAPAAVGERAVPVELTGRALDGGEVDVDAIATDHVALWMWAPWCPTCNGEAPRVAEVLREHGDEVTFVGVPALDDDDAMRAFVAEHGLEDMPQLVDDDGTVWARYGVAFQPALVLIGPDGEFRVSAGALGDELPARIEAFLDGR